MNIITTNDQVQCLAVLTALDCLKECQPEPPKPSCVALAEIDPGLWLVIENNRGSYIIHALEGGTRDDAWAYYNRICNSGLWKPSNVRIEIAGSTNPQIN